MKVKFLLIILLNTFMLVAQKDVISEDILLMNDSIRLPGTLTYVEEQTPLLIWVHGSGGIDRNGNQITYGVKANYIKQFRDQMNKKGFAFYSYDKRTANPKNALHNLGMIVNDLVKDLNIAIDYFKNNKEFSQIILVGHSQGSLMAMLASNNINKYISLAGTSRNFDKILVDQLKNNPNINTDTLKAHFKELRKTGKIEKVNPVLLSLFSPINLPFIKSYIQYDPVEEIKKLKIPVLIVNGTKDLQVPIEDAKSLHQNNTNSELVIIENMNHVLKEILNDVDNEKSYYSEDYLLSKKLVEVVTSFIKK